MSGRALLYINHYHVFDTDDDKTVKVKKDRCLRDNITYAEQQGFWLYSKFVYHAPLNESVLLKIRLLPLYTLQQQHTHYPDSSAEQHLAKFNSFYKPSAILFSTPWLDAIWLFPTWALVNENLQRVNEQMSKLLRRGIFRVWPSTPKTLHLTNIRKEQGCFILKYSQFQRISLHHHPIWISSLGRF